MFATDCTLHTENIIRKKSQEYYFPRHFFKKARIFIFKNPYFMFHQSEIKIQNLQ